MDMKLNSDLVRTQRQRRAWSQEHLAEVSDLGVRTIQRIESTGIGSHESALALAATLEVPLRDLLVVHAAQPETRTWWQVSRGRVAAAGLTGASVAALLLVARMVSAQQVLLDIGVEVGGEEMLSQLTTDAGADVEMRVDEAFRMTVLPTLQDDQVFLTTRIYEYTNGDYALIGEPKLLVADRNMASVEITSDTGQRFRVEIRPEIKN
jgi:transcriptional regulator with XRE-family HTH domain